MTPTNRPGWTWDAETAEWRHESGWTVHRHIMTDRWNIRDERRQLRYVSRYRPVARKRLVDAMRIAEREAGQ